MSRADDPPPRPDVVPAASRAVDLSDAARRAQALIDGGELPAALDVLRMAISGASLDGDDPQAQLADACRLYAGVLAALGETYTATPYAAYAHAACARLFAPTDPRSMHADATYAYVLRVTGYPVDAVTLHRDLVNRLDKRFGARGRPALAGHADFAVALHAAGECVEAKRVLRRAYVAYRDTFGGGDPEGIRMLARLAAMTRDCGGFEKAHQYFDRARALCAENLPHGDPLTRNVTALARAGIDERHVCGEPSVTVVARAGRPGPVVRRPDGAGPAAGPVSGPAGRPVSGPGVVAAAAPAVGERVGAPALAGHRGPPGDDARRNGDAPPVGRPAAVPPPEPSTASRMPARPDASTRPTRSTWPDASVRPGVTGPDASARSSGHGWPDGPARPSGATRPDVSARSTGPGWTDAPARAAGPARPHPPEAHRAVPPVVAQPPEFRLLPEAPVAPPPAAGPPAGWEPPPRSAPGVPAPPPRSAPGPSASVSPASGPLPRPASGPPTQVPPPDRTRDSRPGPERPIHPAHPRGARPSADAERFDRGPAAPPTPGIPSHRPFPPWDAPPARPVPRDRAATRDHAASPSRDGLSDWSDMSEHADDVKRGNPVVVERTQPQAGVGGVEERVRSRTDEARTRPAVSRDVVRRTEAPPPAYPKSGVDGVVDPVLAADAEPPPARAPQATFGRVRRANRTAPADPTIHNGEWISDDRP